MLELADAGDLSRMIRVSLLISKSAELIFNTSNEFCKYLLLYRSTLEDTCHVYVDHNIFSTSKKGES